MMLAPGSAVGAPTVTGPTIHAGGIDRLRWDRLDRRTFVREYLNAARPVIVQGAIDHWPALGKWTPEFFRAHHGSLEVVAGGRPWKLGELIDRILVSTPSNPAPYLHNQLIVKWPPELSADISPMPECTRPNYLESRLFPPRAVLTAIEAYIGGSGAKFPTLHYDGLHTHAFLMQLYGVKEYLVFPPDQSRYFYPLAEMPNVTSIPDIENVDLAQFPLFAKAEGSHFELHPGETLFVPAGWWHTARILTTAITVSINGVSAGNCREFRRDYCAGVASYSRLKATLMAPYLSALGVLLSFSGTLGDFLKRISLKAVHDGEGIAMASPQQGEVGRGKRIGKRHFRSHPLPGLPRLGKDMHQGRNIPGSRLMSEPAPKALALTPVDFDPFADAAAPALLPLTEPQAEVWAAVQMSDEASCAYNQCYSLTLRGALSAESMQNALRQVMDRHDALRVSIDPETQQQLIGGLSQIVLPVIDLSGHSPDSRTAEIERLLHIETTRPFDLASGPLLRAALVREAPDLHRLIVTVHHIVCDGWSSAVLFGDLARIYAADRRGVPAQLPVAASYCDYVAREAVRADDAQARADADYWAQQYTDSIPVLELPLDAPRPGIKTYSGARQELRLDESLCRALKAAGAKHGCTLFVTLFAGFEALISRLSGQEDLVVGVPMAGQTLLENSHLVGHCVNLIPLRCRIEPAARFVDYLKGVRHAFLDAQSHQQVSFGSLVRKLNVPRDLSRTPLVSVTFNIDKLGTPFDFSELAIEAVETPKRFLNFEISINVVDSGRDLIVECEYNTDLFTAATIERWLGHYQALLEAIASGTEQPVGELPLLTEAERHQLLVEWNDTATDYPADALLHELFEDQARRTPDDLAVVFEDQRLTYRELDARTNQLAHHLNKYGVGPDTVVAICVQRSLEMVVGLLGILKAGGAYVPIDPELPQQRIAYMLEELQSPAVLTQHRLRAQLSLDLTRTICLDTDWEAIARESASPPSNPVTASHIAYVIYTSGSTGGPKGVMVPHAGICNHMFWMQRAHPLERADVQLQKTPFGFDASVWEFFAPLLAGARLVMARPGGHLDAAYLAETILLHGVSILQLVPSQLHMLLQEPTFWRCAPPLKNVYCGGEPLTKELCEEFYRRLPRASLHNLYGPTEACIDSTSWDCPHDGIPASIPVGRPIHNTRTYIVNAWMQPSPIGVPGELLVSGAGLARGYLNEPGLTAEKFVQDPFRTELGARVYKTGDLARFLPDGNIEFLRRMDDHQVKIRGFRVELGEIEAVLAEHPEVRQVAVHLWRVAANDVRIVACCVPAKAGALAPLSLRKHLQARLPEYMVPQYFVPVEEIPLTPNGKVDRRRLPTPVVTESGIGQHETPADPVEAKIAEIWTKLLQPARPIGRNDRFFEMGGHSLLGLQALRQMEYHLGVKLDFRVLFQENLAELATRCQSERVAGNGRYGGGKAAEG